MPEALPLVQDAVFMPRAGFPRMGNGGTFSLDKTHHDSDDKEPRRARYDSDDDDDDDNDDDKAANKPRRRHDPMTRAHTKDTSLA
jgi:hypothetical protein